MKRHAPSPAIAEAMPQILIFRLFFLLSLACISLGIRLMQPLPWAILSILQPLIVIAGVVVPLVTVKDGQLALWTGWCLLLFFHVPAIIANIQVGKAMARMDADSLETWAKIEQWLLWGRPGQFWHDMHLSYALVLRERQTDANRLLDKWDPACQPEGKDKGKIELPKAFRDTPSNYRLYGQAVMWQWSEVTATYEMLKKKQANTASISFLAARAYLENQEPLEAATCLRQVHFDETIYPLDTLATNLMPFFSLTGARAELERLTRVLKATNASVPQSLIDLWRGRCEITLGAADKAASVLAAAQDGTAVPLLRKRIARFLEPLSSGETMQRSPLVDDPSVRKEVQEIWQLFRRAAFIQEILSPRRKSICVNVICLLSVFTFLASANFLLPLGLTMDCPINPLTMGASYEGVVKQGQYWRLISYLFYHSDLLHIGSNLVGLYIFGRIAENIFGSSRFLAIYFVGGVLSGLSHIFLSDKIAVGASGAIQAVFAACAVGIIKLKGLPPSLRSRYLSFMGGITLFQILLDQFVPFIAVFAHLGGLLAGLALGTITSVRDPSRLDGLDDEVDGTQQFI